MKKILMSVLVIAVAVSVSVVGLSGAWFSDVEESGGYESNILQTGIIELDGIGDIGTVSDLKPCETDYASIIVHVNADSNRGEGWLHIKNIESTSFNLTGGEKVCDPDQEINDIQDWMTLDLAKYWPGYGKWIIEPEDDIKLGCAECFWIPLGVLEPCVEYELRFSFHLQEETPNCYQSDQCQFDIEVLLQQVDAPAPEPEFPVGDMKTVRLENKTGDPDWDIIWEDETYGVLNYWVVDTTSGEFHGKLIAKGLNPNTYYQVSLNSPPCNCTAGTTCLLLGSSGYAASQAAGHWSATWEGGWWTDGPGLDSSCTSGAEGVYNIVMDAVTDGNGDMTITFDSETFMQSGTYNNVKVIVKEYKDSGGSVTTTTTADIEAYTKANWGTGTKVYMQGVIMEVAPISFVIP